MSRTTVYRLLALSGPPAYEREPAASLLDPFKGAVLAMLREDASVPATVIREHLQRSGYAGGITILKDYLASVRPQFKATPDFGRTAYLPGELLQADWWDTGVDVPVHVIDFDRGRLRAPGAWARGNVARLRRSLMKLARNWPAGRCSAAAWASLLAGYASCA